MARTDPVHMKVREICLSLPDTKETMTWGQPHFRVGEKIFAGYGKDKSRSAMSFKLDMDHADLVVQDPRFKRAPYVGHRGWVEMDASDVKDWELVRSMILESYQLIAPKKTLAKLPGAGAAAPAKKPAAKKPAAKKPRARTAR